MMHSVDKRTTTVCIMVDGITAYKQLDIDNVQS